MNKIKKDKTKKLNGFTFVEIIIVISVISIVSFGGVFYFQDFVNNQYIQKNVNNMTSEISLLDQKIKNQDLFDYQFLINKGDYGYSHSQNNIGSQNIQNYTFDTINNTINLFLENPLNNIWGLSIHNNNKQIDYFTESGTETINIEAENNTKIESTFSGSNINTLSFYYIDQEEINSIQVLDILDRNMSSINSLNIENKNGKKSYKHNNIEVLTPIYIIFSRYGKEFRLEIN